MRCEAITQAGSRCRLDATPGATWCYSHDPARVEERRRIARKAGRSGGNGRSGASELAGIKRDIRGVLDGVLDGRIDRRSVGRVTAAAYSCERGERITQTN